MIMWYQLKCAAVAMSGSELLALLRCIDSVAPISEMLISHATGAGLLAPGVPDGLTRIATVNYDGCATWLPSIVQFDWALARCSVLGGLDDQRCDRGAGAERVSPRDRFLG